MLVLSLLFHLYRIIYRQRLWIRFIYDFQNSYKMFVCLFVYVFDCRRNSLWSICSFFFCDRHQMITNFDIKNICQHFWVEVVQNICQLLHLKFQMTGNFFLREKTPFLCKQGKKNLFIFFFGKIMMIRCWIFIWQIEKENAFDINGLKHIYRLVCNIHW